jgi:hypothetical protein
VKVLLAVVNVFERLHIPYLLGGSMASALYGVARSTLDADMIVELHEEQVHALVAALGEGFYADEEMIRDAIRHRSSFNLIHLVTMFKVDVFIQKERPFDRIQFKRKVEQIISVNPEQKAYVSSAEDIILAKLEWYRMGGEVSDRQWRDILGVLKVQAGRLDFDYLQKWAGELDVGDLLQRALSESQ